MITGFNTNVQHRGVLFHVQTEDSGLALPHIITHVYYGGTIVRSEKSRYEDLLESDAIEYEVRNLMETQHKAMLEGLRQGEFDGDIKKRLGGSIFSTGGDTHVTASEGTPPPIAAPGRETPSQQVALEFGQGVQSDKPLDEVVLDYLVEKARKRKRAGR